jgi:hypothetical protein
VAAWGGMLVADARGAAAPIRLIVLGALPFTEGELVDAVAIRLPLDAEAKRTVSVRPAGEDAVSIEVESKRRVIVLLGDRGAQAARRVALAILDLALDAADLPPLGPESRLKPAPTTSVAVTNPALHIEPSHWTARARIAALGGASRAAATDATINVSGIIDGSIALAESLRLGFGAGYTRGTRTSIDAFALSLDSFPLRAGLSYVLPTPQIEIRASGIVTPYAVSAGPASTSGANAGAELALLYFQPISDDLDAAAAIGVDGYATRDEFHVHGKSAFATERVAVWAAIGVAWEIGR